MRVCVCDIHDTTLVAYAYSFGQTFPAKNYEFL